MGLQNTSMSDGNITNRPPQNTGGDSRGAESAGGTSASTYNVATEGLTASYVANPVGEVKKLKRSSASRALTVMVIDDSKTIRRSAESLLQKEGWSVVTAVDGFDALAKVVEHEPDVVFADIMMPRLDGYQTCALIKNNARYNRTPVIMLSSKDSIFDKARGRVVGSEHYLTKPFSRDDLVSAVLRHTGYGTGNGTGDELGVETAEVDHA